ncbi:protein ABIL1-like [Juglans microcarpa x Juglans regia]|uniref:protein ABIL1-like n=1 Tax=Juglans microcarpa x Juglans regia TaxID=2249226 RepID=UPI001B7E32E0|nr:protein ABIL1-like [Juglans microcarpa x Juglans regia]
MMMEVEQPRTVNPPMTFDEVSMERSKSFVKALQELKNLRPQLYTAAEYCEKSYLNSDQKEMVLDNLKDYALRALVNAVDHLGTVAYKLTDLLEQQTLEVSTMELNVSCLNQRLLTCQTYMNGEGLRQQQLLAFIPRHHKQYILPNSVNKRVHFNPHIQTDMQNHFQARARLQPSGNLAPKTLSWHLASETKTTLKGIPHASTSSEDPKVSGKTSGVFHLSDNEKTTRTNSPTAHLQFPSGGSASSAIMQTLSGTRRDGMKSSQALTRYRSFENQNRRDIACVPVRSKSILSSFFVKQKTPKLKAGSVL